MRRALRAGAGGRSAAGPRGVGTGRRGSSVAPSPVAWPPPSPSPCLPVQVQGDAELGGDRGAGGRRGGGDLRAVGAHRREEEAEER